uniref:Transcriptional regulator ycf27 n=1 Tax=Attheya septentrionalis TaxID=420275 RepID=A0A7S2UIB0_9STRA|mmetsp:Transcript_24789/g.44896  ORF Transcript_24789/g.44896 Transcript_24789/m.44896 type:complete len:356 (+) Transcript_24789:147-1214(+)
MSRCASYWRWTWSVATIVIICVIRVSFVAAFATHPSSATNSRLQMIISRDTLVPWRQRNDVIWKLLAAMDDETDEMDSHWIGDELTEADEMETNGGNSMRPEEFSRQRDPMWYERSKKWVVIVDDEEPIRQAVGQYLFDSGYQVTACADATMALDMCRGEEEQRQQQQQHKGLPDLIVSDVRMPGMDGIELLNEIRADPELVGIPVVLLTAKGMTQDRIRGFQAGADAYIPKPFDPEELLSIIDSSIQRHEMLNAENVQVGDLKKELDDIKYLLQTGGAGVGNGWVTATKVFLTPDERKVLKLLCQGNKTKDIAEELFSSPRRVEQHLTSMYRKTQVSNRTELVRWAISTGNVQI